MVKNENIGILNQLMKIQKSLTTLAPTSNKLEGKSQSTFLDETLLIAYMEAAKTSPQPKAKKLHEIYQNLSLLEEEIDKTPRSIPPQINSALKRSFLILQNIIQREQSPKNKLNHAKQNQKKYALKSTPP